MKRLDIVWFMSGRAQYSFMDGGAEYTGYIRMGSAVDCTGDLVQTVYDKLEEDDIKLVGKCEVYCNGKLWEVVDNG